VVLLGLWAPLRIEETVLAWVLLLLPAAAEDSSVVEHSSHTQHDRLLPTPSSKTVMRIRPTTHEIPAATRLPINRERRRGRGSDLSFENGRFIHSKTFRKEDFFLRPPGIVVTAPGTRARYTFRKSTPAVMSTEETANPTSVPATPKREVRAAAAGETIPTARTLGRSRTVGCCWVTKLPPNSQLITFRLLLLSLEILLITLYKSGKRVVTLDSNPLPTEPPQRASLGLPMRELPLFTELPRRWLPGN
jgi:hypothetical protein